MLLLILATVTLFIILGLACYQRLPAAGPCPRCGGPVERAAPAEEERRGFAALRGLTVAARCPACTWDGRMRPGPEPGAVRLERRGGREDS